MSKTEYSELYSEYLLDQLADDKRTAFEQHLQHCAECRDEIHQLEELLYQLPATLPATEPPVAIRQQLERRIKVGRSTAGSSSGGNWRNWAVAAGVAALLLGAAAVVQQRELAQRARRIEALLQENAGLSTTVQTLQEELEALSVPGLRFASLQGQSGFETVAGNAFIEPGTRRTRVLIRNLPALPPGTRYQLWIIEADQPPHPSQLFAPVPGGVTEVTAPLPVAASRVSTVAVTVEPAAGSPAPTGSMVFVGHLSE